MLVIVITVDADVALIPMFSNLPSALKLAVSPDVMLVSVSPGWTTYETVSCPPNNPGAVVVIESELPVPTVPPMVAEILPLTLVPNVIVSVPVMDLV